MCWANKYSGPFPEYKAHQGRVPGLAMKDSIPAFFIHNCC